MTSATDPYRALGLEPGASPAEIKRAYRKLVKAYHPDSAGERALPRFLAIQAAYERLTAAPPGSAVSSPRDGPGRRGSRPAQPPPPSRPWSADAERARATRDAFRQRSTRTGARSGSGAAGATGPAAGSPPGAGSTPGAGGGGPSGAPGNARPGRGSRRGRSKATIGSTSYDGTEGEPFEPGWSGAGWYGAASGTYWTINPKEYADPRKHGPEYLARARRNGPAQARPDEAGTSAAGPASAADRASATDREPFAREARPPGGPASADTDAPGTARAQPASAEGRRPGAPATARMAAAPPAVQARPRPSRTPGPAPRPTASAFEAPSRTAQPARFGGLQPMCLLSTWRGRLILAALAWFPLGLAIFGIHGQVTGCSQFLASCTDPVAWSVWIPQVAVFGLLLASPRLAWIAASGSIVLLCLVVPLAAILTAGSGGRPPSVETTELLYAAMAAGWLAGVAIALSGRIPLPPWRAARVR